MLLWKPTGTDPVVESRARDQARWLIRDHGDQAEAMIAQKLRRADVSPPDRYRYELTARELRRLRRAANRHPGGVTAVTVWQPRLFSPERLLRLFGVQAIDRRKRSRD